jgi:malectin (di-glucose binding ER protein)
MQNVKRLMHSRFSSLIALSLVLALAGCKTKEDSHAGHDHMASSKPAAAPAAPAQPVPATPAAPAATPAPAVAPAVPAAPAAPAVPKPAATIRIRAGSTSPLTDADGNVWLADQGFADGETTDRAEDTKIANTTTPALYRSERYLMSAFSFPLPNGKYTVKLHFAETYEGITGPGERVFSFNVEGQEFKDFDVWVKAGGPFRAYIETVNVDITDGKLDIGFTAKTENPEINGIEIIPAS